MSDDYARPVQFNSPGVLGLVVKWNDLMAEAVKDVPDFDYPPTVVEHGRPVRHPRMNALCAVAIVLQNQADYFQVRDPLKEVVAEFREHGLSTDLYRDFLRALARVMLTSVLHDLVSWQPAVSERGTLAWLRKDTNIAHAGSACGPLLVPGTVLRLDEAVYDLPRLDSLSENRNKLVFAPKALIDHAAVDAPFVTLLDELLAIVERNIIGDLRFTARLEPVVPCKGTVQATVRQENGLLTIALPEKLTEGESFFLSAAFDTAAYQIHRDSQRGPGNRMIVGSDVAGQVRALPEFKPTATATVGHRITKIGTLRGRYTVLCDPLYPDKEALMVYSGDAPADHMYAFAPFYVAVDGDNLVLRHATKILYHYARLVKTAC